MAGALQIRQIFSMINSQVLSNMRLEFDLRETRKHRPEFDFIINYACICQCSKP